MIRIHLFLTVQAHGTLSKENDMSYLYNQVKAYRDVYGPAASTNSVVTTSGDGLSWYYTFTATGTFTPFVSFTATVLAVGGGGAGGGRMGGGGGGGGVVTQDVTFTSGTVYTTTLGLGGAGAYLLSTNGSASSITYNAGANTLVAALGGGHGAVFWRGATGAVFNGSISGTTLTSGTVTAGTIATGQTLYHASIPAGVTITAGAGTSWTVSPSVSATGSLTNIYSTLAGYAAAGVTTGLVGSGGGGTLGHDTAPGQFQIAGLGTSGQGNTGGAPGNSTTQYGSAGGGGAGAAGAAASGNSGGAGGGGYTAFNGVVYGGGGGGGDNNNTSGGAGGSGGGGAGYNAGGTAGTNGLANTGGGGGGFRNIADNGAYVGGNGGSGIIIIKALK